MSVTEIFKPSMITPLARQVVQRGMCSKCHKKTLGHLHSTESFSSWKCASCQRIFMLEPEPPDSASVLKE